MKNFSNYTPEKYSTSDFQKVEEGIYRTKSPYGNDEIFVTFLTQTKLMEKNTTMW